MFALSPLRHRLAGHDDDDAPPTSTGGRRNNNPSSSAHQADLELGIRAPPEGANASRRANNFSGLSTSSTQRGGGGPEDGLAPGAGSGGGHGREASGRSVRSALSAFSLGNLRDRDRNHTLHQVEASVERQREREEAAAATGAGAGTTNNGTTTVHPIPQGWRAALASATPSRVIQAFHNGGISDPRANAAAAANAANNNNNAAANTNNNGQQTDVAVAQARAAVLAERKKQATKREKDEAATLFGPTLSNYFGSGSSSSGAVNGGNLAAANPGGANGVPAPAAQLGLPSPDPAAAAAMPGTPSSPVPGGPRRPRLGSRGRARGASLSGLSIQSLNEQYLGHQPASEILASSSPTLATSPHLAPGGLFFDTETPGLKDAPQEQQQTLLMADGIEIETLARWVDRTVGLHSPLPTPVGAGAQNLTEKSPAGSVPPVPSAGTAAAKGGLASEPVVCTTLQSYVNLKRNAIKLSAVDSAPLGQLANGSTTTVTTTGGRANDPLSSEGHSSSTPPPTHTLQLEYDCAAPSASVQVFLRASRKHGSWQNYVPPTTSVDDGTAPRFLAQRGPPPHALGFPVHGAIVKRGFAAKTKASLALRLEFFAPPSEKNKGLAIGGGGAAADGAAENQLTLQPTREEDGDAVVADGAAANRLSDAGPAADGSAVDLQARPYEPLSKEARADKAAREKVERETLKMAIVMEALDEDGEQHEDLICSESTWVANSS